MDVNIKDSTVSIGGVSASLDDFQVWALENFPEFVDRHKTKTAAKTDGVKVYIDWKAIYSTNLLKIFVCTKLNKSRAPMESSILQR